MKQGIHPETHLVHANCACGSTYNIEMATNEDLAIEVCSQCHPFYTGKQNLIDTAGRVDKFKERQLKTAALKAAAKQKTTKIKPASEVETETKAKTKIKAKAKSKVESKAN
ncbi:MAG: 50S ribosomal protein L31 [bacterium]|nr:50S ribosomal protein L31 [bacterium]